MDAFHGRHFQGEIILWAVRWYCKYGISYRQLDCSQYPRHEIASFYKVSYLHRAHVKRSDLLHKIIGELV